MQSTLDQVGQLLFIGIKGASLLPEEKDFILKNKIGGIVLFSRNFKTLEELVSLNNEIHGIFKNDSSTPKPFIGIDMEGGRVARLKDPFTIWPPLRKIGNLNSTSLAFKFASSMGLELSASGIDINFAPCVDILTNPKNELVGDRSLSPDPEVVSLLSSAIVRGYIKGEVLPCPKHFPGHGNTLIDSHLDLPIEQETTLDQLRSRELLPFKKVIRARTRLLMSAHILFPKIDPKWPASLSKIFITDLLRSELRYRDIVFTDDLDMGALRKNYSVEEIAVQALTAGANILLYCNDPESPPKALATIKKALLEKTLPQDNVTNSLKMISDLKKSFFSKRKEASLSHAKTLIGSLEHKDLAQNIKEGVLPKNLSTDA